MVVRLNKPPEEHHPRRYQSHKKEQQPSKKKIRFSLFLQTVLDFQLKNHEKLLKPLIQIFKVKDRDSDGIIDEDEFISIIEELCDEAADLIPELLAIVDPYETKSITFTQVVRLVANYPENNPILMRYLEPESEEAQSWIWINFCFYSYGLLHNTWIPSVLRGVTTLPLSVLWLWFRFLLRLLSSRLFSLSFSLLIFKTAFTIQILHKVLSQVHGSHDSQIELQGSGKDFLINGIADFVLLF